MGIDYDRSDSCSFTKQYQADSVYLDQLSQYLENHPLFETLLIFYQFQGDRVLNNYLRWGLFSATSYIMNNQEIKNRIINPSSPSYDQFNGFKMILERYGYESQQFVKDLDRLEAKRFSSKYKSFIEQATRDLQTYILKSPPTTNELITFRFIDSSSGLNLGKGRITQLKGFTSTSRDHNFLLNYPNKYKMVFIIPIGSQVIPFIHEHSMLEEEILLPHGTQIIHERTLKVGQEFDVISTPSPDYSSRFKNIIPRYDLDEDQLQDIECNRSQIDVEIYIFRVLSDTWERKAALAYDPLKYNLYGPCLDQVSEKTGASIDTLKRISEEHLFS